MKNLVEKSPLNNIGFILSDATLNSQNCARNRMNILFREVLVTVFLFVEGVWKKKSGAKQVKVTVVGFSLTVLT